MSVAGADALGAVVVTLVVTLVVVVEVDVEEPLSLDPQAVNALMVITAAIPAVTETRR